MVSQQVEERPCPVHQKDAPLIWLEGGEVPPYMSGGKTESRREQSVGKTPAQALVRCVAVGVEELHPCCRQAEAVVRVDQRHLSGIGFQHGQIFPCRPLAVELACGQFQDPS